MNTFSALLLAFLAIVNLFACQASEEKASSSPIAASSSNAETVVVAGTIAIEADSSESTPIENQVVEIQDASGVAVGRSIADAEGNYEIGLSGQIAISAALELADSSLTLVSLIEDNGKGEVLGIREPINIDSSKITSGRFEAGRVLFKEVAAIKGVIKFVDADGVENNNIAKIGTDIYLPGTSFVGKADHLGKFLLLYIQPGSYQLRVEKGNIAFEQAVSVAENETLNLGTLEIQSDTKAPLTSVSLESIDFRNPICPVLSVNETGAKTYFTIDGSTPIASQTFAYDEAIPMACGDTTDCKICITSSATLKYFSVDTAGNAEDQKSQFYFYNSEWADPSDQTAPVSSVYIEDQLVTDTTYEGYTEVSLNVKSNEGGKIWYTSSTTGVPADPSQATSARSQLLSPLNIANSTSFRFYVVDYAGNAEAVKDLSVGIWKWKRATSLPITLDPERVHKVTNSPAGEAVLIGKTLDADVVKVYTYNFATNAWTERSSCSNPGVGCPVLSSKYKNSANTVGAYDGALIPTDNKIVFADQGSTYLFDLSTYTWSKEASANYSPSFNFIYFDAEYQKLVSVELESSTNNFYIWDSATDEWDEYAAGGTGYTGSNFIYLGANSFKIGDTYGRPSERPISRQIRNFSTSES